ncbi:AraC family transcriptional regulator [Teredinibacter turnerae]|uniref:AraC family transcriptional regulator n=1 Tax=Teredinibacter turnerae TaxID=2426 RepID=UPI000378D81C|nr:helix-turn-helix domain-containing protein [Teredinibacter turnerae]
MKSRNLFICLAVLTFCAAAAFLLLSRLRVQLLPAMASDLPFSLVSSSDTSAGGQSEISVMSLQDHLVFKFELDAAFSYPYAAVGLVFKDNTRGNILQDLTRFSKIAFNVQCSSATTLNLVLYTLDAESNNATRFENLRPSLVSFPCGTHSEPVEIDLQSLVTQDWWLSEQGLPPTDTFYDLHRVYSISLVNSRQTPRSKPVRVEVDQLTLAGWDLHLLLMAVGCVFSGCALLLYTFLYTFIRSRLSSIETQPVFETRTAQVEPDEVEPAVVVKHLQVTTKKDREKFAVLQYLATEYTRADLSLNQAISQLGINRTKLNSILREETGLTFSSYLNKLRLEEAARLLLEMDGASIAEVAHSVGYNNASYFNRIFKTEYGCSPTTYRKRVNDNQTAHPLTD